MINMLNIFALTFYLVLKSSEGTTIIPTRYPDHESCLAAGRFQRDYWEQNKGDTDLYPYRYNCVPYIR